MPRDWNTLLHAIAWPRVRSTHPNFHGVLLGMVLVHYCLAASSYFGDHDTALWYFFGGRLGLFALGLAHLGIAAAMTVGAYRDWMWVRRAMLASVTIYLLKTNLFIAAVMRSYDIPQMHNLSLEVPIFNIGLVLLSVAAYQQPAIPYHSRELT